ncbi:MAG: hypothetical protein EAZ71_13710, partial [Verrucomicrobia bacterium]
MKPAASRSTFGLATLFLFASIGLPAAGQDRLADLLAEPGANLSDPASRQRIEERLRAGQERRRGAAREKARQLGLAERVVRPNGAIQEIADFDGEIPIYLTTHNANAAISTGANLVRSSYAVDGSGVTVGVWDGGSVRSTHQEFNGRVTVKDASFPIDHATHVGGTIAASGVVASAKGMAPATLIDSYDWNSDVAEMTSRGASGPAQAGKIYLSNHSYGYVSGWNYVNNGTRVWEWYGNGSTSIDVDQDFGRYNANSRDQDSLAYNLPYYLIFRSAGNDRVDNPSSGQQVALIPGSSTVVPFDPNLHPKGDGLYRGGFETIAYDALGKNIITIGSATDAVTSGSRDPSKANSSTFSSWGPTDDGRIKPDLVANGDGVYSSLNGGDASYGTYSGTSMSSPNAAGSAALLIQHYGNLFPGQAMRASTLKGLLIHSADDRGNPGPDYRFGWGLIHTKAAADLISDHAAQPVKQRITENQLNNSTLTRSHSFIWDGSSPIRATLCWTDPAGTATTTSDLRSPRLINNLNLKIISPGGAEFLPWVMPFVGTWTEASMNSAATTGINNTDNVEQVLIPSPAIPGTWQVVVSLSGTLSNSSQNYSLLLDGASTADVPPPPLSIASITPASGLQGLVTVDLAGTSFEAGTQVKLSRSGHPDIEATGEQKIGESIRCQLDLTSAAAGPWSVVATNPDLETATLNNGFTVIGSLWAESFDGSPSGWVSQATTGSNNWSRVQTYSHSPSYSYFAPAPGSKTTTSLTSPAIAIPANATGLQVSFWHRFSLESARDGGKLDFSINGGTWFEAGTSGSGTAFASNGYNSNIGGSGGNASEFAGTSAWSGESGGFINTLVNLTDTTKFAGKSLRIRWRIATNARTGSNGWWVDSISLVGGGDVANLAPTVATTASSASTATVTDADGTVFQILSGSTSNFTVLGADDAGESALTYTWTATGPAPVFFANNGSNTAKSTEGIFESSGDYLVNVAIRDAQGLTTTSSLNVRVVQTSTDLSVSPASASLAVGASQPFTAILLDQFGQAMSTQPTSFSWTTSGGGSINNSGVFSATSAGGPFVIRATSGSISQTASVTVVPLAATIQLSDLTQTYDGSPKSVSSSTTPAGLAVAISYDGSSNPPVAAGSYPVSAPNYQGSASGTLVITKANATIELSDLTQTYDGSPKSVSSSTTPAGLAVAISYDGSSNPPVAAGSYPVSVTITNPNYQGSASGTLVITKANATIQLSDLTQTYDGSPKSVSNSTTPAGLAVAISYDGSSNPPVAAGSYPVSATITDPNYQGSASGTLVITKADAAIQLSDLTRTYDGSPKSVSSSTTPAGLAVAISYDGSSNPPVAAGSYPVSA